jgi:hypothetical protein
MTNASQGEKTSGTLYFVAGIGLLVLAPYMVARVCMQFAQAYFPTWAQFIVVAVFFVLLFLWAWLISGNRGVRLFTQLYKQGIRWPFLFSIAMLVFALLPFAALSSILADLGYAIFEPSVPRGEFWRLQDLYLWHFMNSVPGLKIPETLLWPEPFRYKDHLSGVLLLVFKIIVIIPVIASFTVWARLRKDDHPNQSQRI